MSNDLDEVFNKMFDNLIPGVWQKVYYYYNKFRLLV